MASNLGRRIALGTVTLALLASVHQFSYRQALDADRRDATHRLTVYAAGLTAVLDRYDYLPYLLAVNDDVLRMLAKPEPAQSDRVNRFLERVNREAGTEALYVMDQTGHTWASSNWRSPQSYVGNVYTFRPYFKQAVSGGRGEFYAAGATTRSPGYFLARPAMQDGKVAGVAALKVDLSPLERTWLAGRERLLVVDDKDVVALSAEPAWKFRPVTPLTASAQRTLAETRQYYTSSLTPLPWKRNGDLIRIDGNRYLVLSRPVGRLQWSMWLLVDTASATATARIATLAAAGGMGVLWLWALYARQRRRRISEKLAARAALEAANRELEARVESRTAELADSNARLLSEVEERTRAERDLREAQHELIQASKLAALGQMATGVAHELNQPLAALRGYADNTRLLWERGDQATVSANLERIAALVDRLAGLTGQLKVFARKQRGGPGGPANVSAALNNVCTVLGRRIDEAAVSLREDVPPDLALPMEAPALEQVMSNLIGNALDALADRPAPRQITVRAWRQDGTTCLSVEDNGPGLAGVEPGRLFEPFYTTKPLGIGLGLGLAIVAGLVRDAGGGIGAEEVTDGGGARFTVRFEEGQ